MIFGLSVIVLYAILNQLMNIDGGAGTVQLLSMIFNQLSIKFTTGLYLLLLSAFLLPVSFCTLLLPSLLGGVTEASQT
jgi:hypothetical protein